MNPTVNWAFLPTVGWYGLAEAASQTSWSGVEDMKLITSVTKSPLLVPVDVVRRESRTWLEVRGAQAYVSKNFMHVSDHRYFCHRPPTPPSLLPHSRIRPSSLSESVDLCVWRLPPLNASSSSRRHGSCSKGRR